MYKEGLEGFDEAENTPRAYVSAASQQDAEKLARENEKLKKNLEKEKFFNKLLDQELKEAKAESAAKIPVDFAPARRGVSGGAFYTLLFLAIAMAGFILFTWYNNKQANVFENPASVSPSLDTEQEARTEEKALPVNESASAAKDTVPEIIAAAPAAVQPSEPIKKSVEPPVTNTNSPLETIEEPKPVKKAAPAPSKPLPSAADGAENESVEAAETTAVTKPAPPVQPARPIIATYKVTSKANFYNSADENTLRSSFISGGNKTVNALEDKNGFIYVEYTNENGMLNRGWLSKKDLTKE